MENFNFYAVSLIIEETFGFTSNHNKTPCVVSFERVQKVASAGNGNVEILQEDQRQRLLHHLLAGQQHL